MTREMRELINRYLYQRYFTHCMSIRRRPRMNIPSRYSSFVNTFRSTMVYLFFSFYNKWTLAREFSSFHAQAPLRARAGKRRHHPTCKKKTDGRVSFSYIPDILRPHCILGVRGIIHSYCNENFIEM